MTRAADVKAALEKTVDAFGRLDFAFNNAGIEPRNPAPTADYDEAEWNRIIDIDLRGVFLCMKYEIPLILKQGGGAIVEHVFGRWAHRHQGQPGVYRREAWRHRTHPSGGPRLRRAERSHQRGLPGVHRHADDDSLYGRDRRGAGEGSIGGAHRKDGHGPRRSPMPSSGCARTRRVSLSAMPSSSTAAKQFSDFGAGSFANGCPHPIPNPMGSPATGPSRSVESAEDA